MRPSKLSTIPKMSHAGGSAEPPRLGLRDRVFLQPWRLDRELAEGCSCDGLEDRARRARQLADPLTRHELAISLRRVVAGVEQPRAVLLPEGIAACREPVEGCREGLLGVAERLEHDGPVNPCGVARIRVLLTDATGPLFSSVSVRSLREAIWWVADELQLCPPHRWACPVIMKLDPEHVAWTCGLCGAIAVSDDPAVRPA
jgi:hypothetical protein